MRCLVTGASGFIGPHLVAALREQGREVRCLVRRTSNVEALAGLDVELAYGDVTDSESLQRAVAGTDEVYHLAGVTKALRAADFAKVNEQGVEHLAAACSATDSPPVVVLVSSLAAAGVSPEDRLRCERDPAAPVSIYGRSKRAGEVVAHRWAERLPISVVRPPIVFGEGDRDMLQMFQPIARWGIHVVPGLKTRRYALIHAADLSAALIAAAERGERLTPAEDGSETGRGYYFVAYEQQPTYAELGRLIGEALERQVVRIVRVPQAFSWMMAAAHEVGSRVRGRASILSIDKIREYRAGSWVCSVEAARQQLGYIPLGTLPERFAQTARWYRQQGWL